MKKLIGILALAALLAACGDDDDGSTPDAGASFGTPAQILAYLDGKTYRMEGANIPSHPNGYSEDVNLGQLTQCYVSVNMAIAAGGVMVTSQLGPVDGTTMSGQVGTCNHGTAAGTPLVFSSTAVLIENVENNGACFDFTVTYTGFAQEGRGSLSADGRTMTLELYFANQATNHRCAAGDPGASGVTLNGMAFTGDARQVYIRQ